MPKPFRMPGTQVRGTKIGNRVILEPMMPERLASPWDGIDSLGDRPFVPERREQLVMSPERPFLLD